ncbi:MAG TPA: ABC transporter substrate-binding protein [Acidimicrobiales bacterium]|nr:ABC transporter substrate-binding protein [Acidimicrobiales bacterium]
MRRGSSSTRRRVGRASVTATAWARRAGRHARTRAALPLLATCVLLSACGARVGPYLGADAAAGQNGAAGSAGGTATAGVAGAPSGAGGAAGGAAAGGGAAARGATASAGRPGAPGASAPGGAPAAVTPQSFSFDPRAEAAACPGSAGNTASDTGVSASQVTVGNVSGLTGPLADSFNQGAEAVNALFAAVNAAGGICGRKLVLDTEDDQQNASTNASDVADLIPKVLAFAGSTSDADNGGVPAMAQSNVPDFGFAINCNRSESPTYWSAAGGSCYQPQGPGKGPYAIDDSALALAKQSGYFPTKLAFLSYNIAISAQAAQQFEYVYQHTFGASPCYTDFSISPASASLESDVAQMQADGCNGVMTTLDVTGNAKLLQAMAQQSFTMPYTYTTFDGYTPAQITIAGQSAAQGLTVGVPFTPLNEPNPTVQLYQQELSTYEPGKQPSGFGFLSWESAQMLVYALVASGHSPSRASVTKAVGALKDWNGGGALGPYTPSTHSVGSCQVDVVVKGNAFVRRAPASGLFCGGQTVAASS